MTYLRQASRCFAVPVPSPRGVVLILLLAAAVTGCDAATDPDSVDPVVTEERPPVTPPRVESPPVDQKPVLPRGVYPLSGTGFELASDDLAPLMALIGDRPIVTLGESYHTSGGYSASRARVIRYLVEKQRFRAVSFEGPWIPAEATRRYVEDGVGTLQEAMAGLSFVPWMNTETLELIRWLRAFNQAHPADKVRFFGGDSQQGDHDAIALRRFLESVGTTEALALKEPTRSCAQAQYDTAGAWWNDETEYAYLTGEKSFPEARHTACVSALAALESYLESQRPSLVAALGEERVRLAEISLVTLRANHFSVYSFTRDWLAAYRSRDEGWAHAFQMLRELRAPGAKTVMWAHNSHIARASEEILLSSAHFSTHLWKNVGTHLDELFPGEVFVLGLTAYRITHHFGTEGGRDVTEPPRDDPAGVELRFHALGHPMLLVDYQDNAVLEAGKEYTWESQGAVETGVPAKHFDAVLFLESSGPQQDYN